MWLLTEVTDAVVLPGFVYQFSIARMSPGQLYAGVLARLPMTALPSPHPASAAVLIDGVTFCSSVLPWAAADDVMVWGEGNQGDRTAAVVRVLGDSLVPGKTVWGGDFNHVLRGSVRYGGSRLGRDAIDDFASSLQLALPTATLPHRQSAIFSIDHIGVPRSWVVDSAQRVAVPALSDHDAYTVTVSRSASYRRPVL